MAPLGAFPDARLPVKAVDEAAAAYEANPSEATRLQLREASLMLHRSLESIPEAVFKLSFDIVTPVVVRTAIEGQWFEYILKAGKPVTAVELSKATGAEIGLVRRYMRVLVADGIVIEAGFETYAPSRTTVAHTIPGLKDGTIHAIDNVLPSLSGLPQYLKNIRFREPQDDTLGPYVIAHGKQFFTHLQSEPEKQKSFNTFMTAQKSSHGGAGGWLDVFPIHERLSTFGQREPDAHEPNSAVEVISPPPSSISGTQDAEQALNGEGSQGHTITQGSADLQTDNIQPNPLAPASTPHAPPASPLIVDLGGGHGHELLEFRRRFPTSHHPRRAILQDLPTTLQHVDTAALAAAGVEAMAHDFFTPQPVLGAQFYYLASVLHDWSDRDCAVILRNIVPAMKINYSSILVVDLVVPGERVPAWHAKLDVILLAIMCGKERSRAELQEVVEGCGLRVLGVTMLATGEGVTEIVLEGDERLDGRGSVGDGVNGREQADVSVPVLPKAAEES